MACSQIGGCVRSLESLTSWAVPHPHPFASTGSLNKAQLPLRHPLNKVPGEPHALGCLSGECVTTLERPRAWLAIGPELPFNLPHPQPINFCKGSPNEAQLPLPHPS